MNVWLALIGGSAPGMLALISTLVINRRTLQASKPRTDAETLDFGIGIQNKVMAAAKEQLAAYELRVDQMQDEIDRLTFQNRKCETREDGLEEHLDVLTDWITDHYRQEHPGQILPPQLRQRLRIRSVEGPDDA